MEQNRFERQIAFILEIDKLKRILRQSWITRNKDKEEMRRENSAEHSWHFAMLAMVLSEYANETVDVHKVIKMALVHDIVEIDAGDTYVYDQNAKEDQEEREQAAAARIFGLLPDEQRDEITELWDEFERGETAEAQFAAAIDYLQPFLLNYHTEGYSWKLHQVTADQVFARCNNQTKGSKKIQNYVNQFIQDAVNKGFLSKK